MLKWKEKKIAKLDSTTFFDMKVSSDKTLYDWEYDR